MKQIPRNVVSEMEEVVRHACRNGRDTLISQHRILDSLETYPTPSLNRWIGKCSEQKRREMISYILKRMEGIRSERGSSGRNRPALWSVSLPGGKP